MSTTTIPTIDQLVAQSAASEAFRTAALDFASRSIPNERIAFNRTLPPVKVLRAISYLLDQEKALPIDRVELEGYSGCSTLVGKLAVTTTDGSVHTFDFTWDCKWRAELQGWTDMFGFADQSRAAREYGYQCMKSWTRLA